jgi:hypothetical protein
LVECQFNELLWLIFISDRNIFRFFYKPLFFLRNSGLQRGNETKSGIAAVPGTGLWRLAPCQPACHEQTMICDFLRENVRRAFACSGALIPVRLKKKATEPIFCSVARAHVEQFASHRNCGAYVPYLRIKIFMSRCTH